MYIHIYIYTHKTFSTMLEMNIKTKKKRDGEIGKQTK